MSGGSCGCDRQHPGIGQSILQGALPSSILGANGSHESGRFNVPNGLPLALGQGGSFRELAVPPPAMIVDSTGAGFITSGHFVGLPTGSTWVRQKVWILLEGWTRPKCDGAADTFRLLYFDELFRVQKDNTTKPVRT